MRGVTLFSAQWQDLSLEAFCNVARGAGYDGVELCCGPHLDVVRCCSEPSYVAEVRSTLGSLLLFAISNHGVGQAVCDLLIDERHRRILPPRVWQDGEPEGVRQRAAAEMRQTARAAQLLGVSIVNGFTGSSIWHLVYAWPPVEEQQIAAGYADFGRRWRPILDEFAACGVVFALEVHPTEIAYDHETTRQAIEAVAGHAAFGINMDPSHFVHQMLDPSEFVRAFGSRIAHVHVKDTKLRLDGRRSLLCSHLPFGHVGRGWDFRSPGFGSVDFRELFRALNDVGYSGPLSVEWEDSGMDRLFGASDAARFVRSINHGPAAAGFESGMKTAK